MRYNTSNLSLIDPVGVNKYHKNLARSLFNYPKFISVSLPMMVRSLATNTIEPVPMAVEVANEVRNLSHKCKRKKQEITVIDY